MALETLHPIDAEMRALTDIIEERYVWCYLSVTEGWIAVVDDLVAEKRVSLSREQIQKKFEAAHNRLVNPPMHVKLYSKLKFW